MGLSDRKVKQRLVGAASARNAAWLNDASLPGQRMLAQMGWKEGQGLGTTMTGMAQNLTVALKLDNKGIGAARYEREARAAGKDAWVGGGGELGSLFDRLNAVHAATPSPAPTAPASDSGDAQIAEITDKKKAKKDKKEKREKKERKSKSSKGEESKEERKEHKRAEKEAKKQAKDQKWKRDKDGEDDEGKKSSRSKKSKKDKKRKLVVSAVAEALSVDPSLATDKKAVKQIKHDVQAGRPIRMAHRAKFLRAKRMVGNDLASVNEILGIKSTPATPGASGTASPAPGAAAGSGQSTPRTYPGPGGSQIALIDVDRKLKAAGSEASGSSSASSSSSSDSSDSEEETGAKHKRKRKAASLGKAGKKGKSETTADSDSDSDSSSDADVDVRRSAKKSKKADKKSKKVSSSTTPPTLVAAIETKAVPAPPATAETMKTDESKTQIGTNAQNLSVHEYLSRRLMLRKAQIARRKKEESEAIWTRAAAISA